MGPKLGEILIAGKHVSPADLKRALDAQLASGGRLGTNLLELGLLDEETLARVLQEQKRVDVATRRMLDDADPKAVMLVPAALAARHEAVPFALDGSRLKVALADPTDAVALDEIAFTSGCAVVPHIAPETRVRASLMRIYGDSPQPPSNTASRLASASTREDVGDALLALAGTAFSRCCLWLVRGDRVMGWMLHQDGIVQGAGHRSARQASATVTEGSLLSRVLASKSEARGELGASPCDEAMASVLGATRARAAWLVPVMLGDAVAIVVQGEPADATGQPLQDLRELRGACVAAGLALEVLLLRSRILQSAK